MIFELMADVVMMDGGLKVNHPSSIIYQPPSDTCHLTLSRIISAL
jgi:hypothetical protein